MEGFIKAFQALRTYIVISIGLILALILCCAAGWSLYLTNYIP